MCADDKICCPLSASSMNYVPRDATRSLEYQRSFGRRVDHLNRRQAVSNPPGHAAPSDQFPVSKDSAGIGVHLYHSRETRKNKNRITPANISSQALMGLPTPFKRTSASTCIVSALDHNYAMLYISPNRNIVPRIHRSAEHVMLNAGLSYGAVPLFNAYQMNAAVFCWSPPSQLSKHRPLSLGE